MTRLSLIAAMAENRVIGKDNRLPWNMPADWKNFKEITEGKTFIMGRKSYLAPDKLLSTSRSIILSHSVIPDLCKNCHRVQDWETALALVKDEPEVFILGGQRIFEQALSFASYIYLTLIHARISGDAFFPEIDESKWQLVRNRSFSRDRENPYDYSFLEYARSV